MKTDLKQVVRDKYTEVVQRESGCCSDSCCGAESAFSLDYEGQEGYVKDADYGLGCGIPTEAAHIETGQTVLDLGAGAGNDVFVARRLVGETGRVIGLDFTEAMVKQANANKAKLGYQNVEFILGDIEDMPLPEDAVDIIISNCVLNLVPDKEKAFGEAYRVLKPGGHFAISDIVILGKIPPAVREVAELYAGCVSGALPQEEYLDIVRKTGFENIGLAKDRPIQLSDELLLEYISPEVLRAFRQSGAQLKSITVVGEKPC